MTDKNQKLASQKRKIRQPIIGQVIKTGMSKTISILIYQSMKKKKYKKYVKTKRIFKAHDEKNQAQKGDIVSIFETKPISKTKRWKLGKIIKKQEG